MKRIVFLMVLAMVSLTAGLIKETLSRQTSKPADMQKSDMKMSSADKSFVMKAASGGMAEVELGQLAVKQANNDEVKQFGQRMVDDHSKANQELKQYAESKGISLPSAMDQSQKKMYDKLSKLSGAAFDREYMSEMLEDHEKDVAEFEKQSKNSKDPELKSLVDKTLPTLKEHLQMARDIAPKVGVKTRGSEKASKMTHNK